MVGIVDTEPLSNGIVEHVYMGREIDRCGVPILRT